MFSLTHIIYMLIPLFAVLILYFILRNRSDFVKKTVVFLISILNMLQHIFKPYIYPQYAGESFGARSTAYNMCALLILISPIILLIGSELWRNFLFYIGSVSGYFAIISTYWLSEPIEEQLRFFGCHALLFLTSFLPILLGTVRINYRKFWRLPFVFYACLMILIINNIITFELGLVGNTGEMTVYEFLVKENPCWCMRPPENYPFVEELVKIFTPGMFLASEGGIDTPILWYAFPLAILIGGGALFFGINFDAKRFGRDIKNFFLKIFHLRGR